MNSKHIYGSNRMRPNLALRARSIPRCKEHLKYVEDLNCVNGSLIHSQRSHVQIIWNKSQIAL